MSTFSDILKWTGLESNGNTKHEQRTIAYDSECHSIALHAISGRRFSVEKHLT